MTPGMTGTRRTPDPVGQIVAWTATIGGVLFAAGFVGPLLLSGGNLGPLLGIFITGPLGVLFGALVGALRAAKESARAATVAIGMVWVVTLLYTLFMMGFAAQFAIPAIPLQFLIIASSIYLLAGRITRVQLPDAWRRFGTIAIATEVAILVMTLFPPVSLGFGAEPTTAPLPAFAFILDGRFEVSLHAALFAANRSELVLEWFLAIAAAIALGFLMRARSGATSKR